MERKNEFFLRYPRDPKECQATGFHCKGVGFLSTCNDCGGFCLLGDHSKTKKKHQ